MHPHLTKLEQSLAKSPLTQIIDPKLESHNLQLWLKRDDLIHPIISGNKWRKLKYNLDAALALGKDTLVSMGGAYSNHLHALAYCGKQLGLHTVGMVRGERPAPLTPSLQDMENWGMALRFVSRSDYRLLRNHQNEQDLPGIKANEYWLPEGGANRLALKGVAEIIDEIDMTYDALCVACGTGATLAGLISKVPKQVSVLGFAALKNAGFLSDDVKSMLPGVYSNWSLLHGYHMGGLAEISPELTAFMADFEEKTAIPLEPVYTGKMLYGVYDLIEKGYFKPGQCIIALHTGGLQGKRGNN